MARASWEPAVTVVVELQRSFPMAKTSLAASLVALAILIGPVGSFAQNGGAGGGAAAGAPAQQTPWVSRIPATTRAAQAIPPRLSRRRRAPIAPGPPILRDRQPRPDRR